MNFEEAKRYIENKDAMNTAFHKYYKDFFIEHIVIAPKDFTSEQQIEILENHYRKGLGAEGALLRSGVSLESTNLDVFVFGHKIRGYPKDLLANYYADQINN